MAVNELLEFTRATSSDSHQCTTATTAGLIICGDFNSPPHTLPYQLMSRGHLDDVILDSLRSTCPFTEQVTPHLTLNQSLLSHLSIIGHVLQCSRIRMFRFFLDFKKHDFLRFFEMTLKKRKKSVAKICL